MSPAATTVRARRSAHTRAHTRARAQVHISRARAHARTSKRTRTHAHITTRTGARTHMSGRCSHPCTHTRTRCGAAEVDHQDQALGFQGHRSSPSPLPLSALPLSALSHSSHSANCRAVIGRHRRRRRRRRCGVQSRRRCGRGEPDPRADVAGVRPALVPMQQSCAQSQDADVGGASPVPAQMWAG
jgi:hypothetical protein